MTRMIRGSVLLAACVGLWSCTNDPTADEAGVPYKIVSLPSVVFVKQDSSQLIAFQLVDQLDGQIPEQWTLTSTSPNFTVAMDSTYRVVYNSDGTLTLPDSQTQVRATITGTALGISNFTVSAGGKSLVVPVNVVPGNLDAVFTPSNPAPGEVVTITMPPTLRLTPGSKISFPVITKTATDTSSIRNLVIAADSMSATFIAAPIVDTSAVVTGVYNTEFPTLNPVTLTTRLKVTGTESGGWTGDMPAAITPPSDSANPVSPSITVTLDPALAFDPTSVFTFPTQTAPILTGISADSTVATMDVGPNVASPLQATKVTFKGAPQFQYTLVTADSVYTQVIQSFPATLSNYTPQIGESVVLTAGAGFSFSPTALATFGGSGPAIVLSRTATTLVIQPWPGSAGKPSVTGVISAAAPAFQLSLPSTMPSSLAMQATATAIGPIAGTDAWATAPTLALGNAGVFDSASFGCVNCGGTGVNSQVYKITLPAGARTFSLTWSNIADLGLYFQTTPGGANVVTTACDNGGNGASGHPETCTGTFTAGTYYLNVRNYAPLYPDPNPIWVAIQVR